MGTDGVEGLIPGWTAVGRGAVTLSGEGSRLGLASMSTITRSVDALDVNLDGVVGVRV